MKAREIQTKTEARSLQGHSEDRRVQKSWFLSFIDSVRHGSIKLKYVLLL